ncbi:MAG: NB-ARC domain-containing protein [Cyanobacteriota bacterium]
MELTSALEVADERVYAFSGRHLSDVEVAILRGAWQGQTYEEIASAVSYSPSYLTRTAGPQLWKVLSAALGEPVSKTNFRAALVRQAKSQVSMVATQESITLQQPDFTPLDSLTSLRAPVRVDWGEVVDVRYFQGREEELNILKGWILREQCHLLAILGLGGVGKSSLAAKLSHQLLDVFDAIIWRSLRNAPPLDSLLQDLNLFLSGQMDSHSDTRTLLNLLRHQRCLIILDNFETLFEPGERAGAYRSGYESYGDLLTLLGESNHQSCFLLTSREKPAEIATLEGLQTGVRTLFLSGSEDICCSILQAKGILGSSEARIALSHRYGNNPLALKIVASSIQELFNGNIQAFVEQESFLFNGIWRLLEQQFKRLSIFERSIVYWLAIQREWITLSELDQSIIPSLGKSQLLESLESLSWRGWIEKMSGRFTLQPVIMEYVTEDLISKVVNELQNCQPSLFCTHALLLTHIKDYIRKTQERLILDPIVERLRNFYPHPATLKQQIEKILIVLREPGIRLNSYGPGNIINLCCRGNVDLNGLDFSGLTIRHAHLQDYDVRGVNLSNARLAECTLFQVFSRLLGAAFSFDGRYLATGDSGGGVHLWQVEDGQLLQTFKGHVDWVRAIGFAPSGSLLVSGGDDHIIRVWDIEKGSCLRVLEGCENRVMSIRVSPDGNYLLSGSEDCLVRLWDLHSGNCLQVWEGHTQPIWGVNWSLDGSWAASCSHDQTIRLWDGKTGECRHVLTGHTDWVCSIAFSPNGKCLASGSQDKTIKIWDVESGKCVRTLSGHSNWVLAVSFLDDQTLVSGSEDQLIRMWDIETGTCLKTMADHRDRIWKIATSGSLFASISEDQTIRFWDSKTGDCLRILKGYTQQVWVLNFHPNKSLLASGGDERIIRIWDVETGNCIRQLSGHTSGIWGLTFSPDGTRLASAGEDQTIRIWTEDGVCQQTIHGNSKRFADAQFSPDGTLLLTSGEHPDIKIWDTNTGTCVQTLRGHKNMVWTLAFRPGTYDGLQLGSCSFDGTARLWDVRKGECLRVFDNVSSLAMGIAFSPDGSLMATSGYGGLVKLWNVDSGKCLQELSGHDSDLIFSVAFSPDGRFLASGCTDHTVRLWDVSSGACLHVLRGHNHWIYYVKFSPIWNRNNKLLLASGSVDETIRLWDPETGECLHTLRSERPYERTNITGIQGLTPAQKETLKHLGAVELS